MINTRITELLGIRFPLVGGTMMSISKAPFVAAVSEAGGLGVLDSTSYTSKEGFSAAIDHIRSTTAKPFAVNINLSPAIPTMDKDIYIDVMAEKGVSVVETSGRLPSGEMRDRFKKSGMTWIHKCAGVRYARKAADAGADIITVVGYENGGSTGGGDIGTLVLVPSVVDAVDVPVIGGGGVSDGRGVLAVLGLGAEGVIMGTRMLATKECPVHDNLKQALLSASELDTILILKSIGMSFRVWANAAAKKCDVMVQDNSLFEETFSMVAGDKARQMYASGDLDKGVLYCGQGVGLVHDIPTVKTLFERIMAEAEQAKSAINAG